VQGSNGYAEPNLKAKMRVQLPVIKPPMSHEPRLTQDLRFLLNTQRCAALGTLNDSGLPFVSMVPYAVEPTMDCLVIHVSGLASHTHNTQVRPAVSILVMQSELPGQSVHALPRVTLDGVAKMLVRDTDEWMSCRAEYLVRFPEADPMTELGDFRFVALELLGARHVAGFGAARSIDAGEVRLALALAK
jgi:putative heme iron utilization protein